MSSLRKIQELIGLTLIFGVFLSATFVMFGSILYLYHHGSDSLLSQLNKTHPNLLKLSHLWHDVALCSPLALIQLGLWILVFTQILRMLLLTWFYINQRDGWFSAITLFITIILIYSIIWQV